MSMMTLQWLNDDYDSENGYCDDIKILGNGAKIKKTKTNPPFIFFLLNPPYY